MYNERFRIPQGEYSSAMPILQSKRASRERQPPAQRFFSVASSEQSNSGYSASARKSTTNRSTIRRLSSTTSNSNIRSLSSTTSNSNIRNLTGRFSSTASNGNSSSSGVARFSTINNGSSRGNVARLPSTSSHSNTSSNAGRFSSTTTTTTTSSSSSSSRKRPLSPNSNRQYSPTKRGSSISARRTSASPSGSKLDIELKDASESMTKVKEEIIVLKERLRLKEFELEDLRIVHSGLVQRRELHQKYSNSHSRERSTSSFVRTENTNRPTFSRHVNEASRSSSSSLRDSREDTVRPIGNTQSNTFVEDPDGNEQDSCDDDVAVVNIIEKRKHTAINNRKIIPSQGNSSFAVSQNSRLRSDSGSNNRDQFWQTTDVPKLLSCPRVKTVHDEASKKLRTLAFNPAKTEVFATGSDTGNLILWKYLHSEKTISKIVGISPSSFRSISPVANNISWNPDGQSIVLGFRDPVHGKGGICIARLQQMNVNGSIKVDKDLPQNQVIQESTSLHNRGVSAIDWLKGNSTNGTSSGIVSSGPGHNLVYWGPKTRTSQNHEFDFMNDKIVPQLLHSDHRSEVSSLCVHSSSTAVYTGGFDGFVVKYDLHAQRTSKVYEKRKPNVLKINCVLEHPKNPNLMMFSCVTSDEQQLIFKDLRQRMDSEILSMKLVRQGRAISQYIVPRFSPLGYHVSCGSSSGAVKIWDLRVQNKGSAQPHQSLQVHQKQVLHATWHPDYNAIISVSTDRKIGLLNFSK